MTRLDPVLPLIKEHKRLWELDGEAWKKVEDAHAALYERLLATAPTTLAGAIAQLELGAIWGRAGEEWSSRHPKLRAAGGGLGNLLLVICVGLGFYAAYVW